MRRRIRSKAGWRNCWRRKPSNSAAWKSWKSSPPTCTNSWAPTNGNRPPWQPEEICRDKKKGPLLRAFRFLAGADSGLDGRQLDELLHQLVLGLHVIGIVGNAVHRADLLALGLVEVAHALRALVGVDHVDLVPLGNRPVGALRFAHIAVDAFIGNHQRHLLLLAFIAYRSTRAFEFQRQIEGGIRRNPTIFRVATYPFIIFTIVRDRKRYCSIIFCSLS